jgi:hypothetical protein
MGKLITAFNNGRAAAQAERDKAADKRDGEGELAQSAANANDDTKALLREVIKLADGLKKQVADLEAERDDAKKLLGEATASADGRERQIADLEAERDATKKLLGEVTASAEQLQKRIAELETEPGVFAEVLLLPGVRKVLLKLVHPDAHPEADEDQRRALAEGSAKLNAAYDLIDKRKKEGKP